MAPMRKLSDVQNKTDEAWNDKISEVENNAEGAVKACSRPGNLPQRAPLTERLPLPPGEGVGVDGLRSPNREIATAASQPRNDRRIRAAMTGRTNGAPHP